MAGGRCKSKNAGAGVGQLHLPAIVTLATVRDRAGVCECRWCSHTIAAKRRVCRRECAQRQGQALARRSDLCAVLAQPSFHAMMPGRLWGVRSILPHVHVDSKSHIRIQARTARFRPGLS